METNLTSSGSQTAFQFIVVTQASHVLSHQTRKQYLVDLAKILLHAVPLPFNWNRPRPNNKIQRKSIESYADRVIHIFH